MKISKKLLSTASALVLVAATVLSNWPCSFVFHQPKEPEGMKKLRKF